MNKIFGYKSKALTVLNIIFMVMIVLTLALFILIGFVDFNQVTGYMLTAIFVVWLYLPYREIKQNKARLNIILEADKHTIEIRDIKNELTSFKINDIQSMKVSKLPIFKYGTITFNTSLRKVTCRYVKDVNQLVKLIEDRLNEIK